MNNLVRIFPSPPAPPQALENERKGEGSISTPSPGAQRQAQGREQGEGILHPSPTGRGQGEEILHPSPTGRGRRGEGSSAIYRFFTSFAFLIFLLLTACASPAQSTALPTQATAYIENKGSDTIVNLALAWAERYQTLHPEVRISVTGGGSGTGIAALINGTVDLANASRQIKNEEILEAQTKGNEPVEHIIARDAIAIIVHPDNPVSQLSLQQIADIYSGKINNWQEVGGEDRPIVRLSRETNSGTHVYFLEEVLRLGNPDDDTLFAANTLLLPSSEGITSEVRQNPNAIGYDGLGYVTAEEKMIAVAETAAGPYVLPSADTVNQGLYPIARDLYMYTNGEPSGVLKTYLEWILAEEAQQIVVELGFVPVTP